LSQALSTGLSDSNPQSYPQELWVTKKVLWGKGVGDISGEGTRTKAPKPARFDPPIYAGLSSPLKNIFFPALPEFPLASAAALP